MNRRITRVQKATEVHRFIQIATISTRKWNVRSQRATLNQAAPFHVVEEECLWIVAGFEFHRATGIEAIGVKAQLRHLILRAVCVKSGREIVARVESIVSPKPPR